MRVLRAQATFSSSLSVPAVLVLLWRGLEVVYIALNGPTVTSREFSVPLDVDQVLVRGPTPADWIVGTVHISLEGIEGDEPAVIGMSVSGPVAVDIRPTRRTAWEHVLDGLDE